jgi:GlpG protein
VAAFGGYMRLIGDLDDLQQANKFVAYLLVNGVESKFDQDGEKYEVWVKDEDQCESAIAYLAEFRQNPDDSKYAESIHQAKSIVKTEEKKRREIQRRVVRVGATGMNRKPRLTLALIGISVLVAILTNFGEVKTDHPIYQALQFVSISEDAALERKFSSVEQVSFRLASISRGEIWRTVTPIFIHYGVIHILFNVYMIFQFGKVIENRYGIVKYGMLVLATAVISNLAQGTVPSGIGGSPPYLVGSLFISSFGGLSGVVYGLFGFFWMKSTYDRSFGFRIPESTVVILIGWMLLCMVPGFSIVSVANWAHGVGLLVGMAIGYYTSVMKR